LLSYEGLMNEKEYHSYMETYGAKNCDPYMPNINVIDEEVKNKVPVPDMTC